jgi:hypothetical protein
MHAANSGPVQMWTEDSVLGWFLETRGRASALMQHELHLLWMNALRGIYLCLCC